MTWNIHHPSSLMTSSFLFGLVGWSVAMLTGPALASIDHHDVVKCAGGRGQGDKWFDGCRWCVCQSDGPLCSPASCSDLVTQVPPCEEVGSSWRDGCYHCKCHLTGIECVADSACTVLMETEDFLSCVEPEDDRCICGVDGTPSCTAEVIDRHAHRATTVALDTSYTKNKHINSRFGYEYNDPESTRFDPQPQSDDIDDWVRRRVKRRSDLDEYLRRRLQHRREHFGYNQNTMNARLRSSYLKPYRFFNRLGGYYNYADGSHGHPNGGYHTGHLSRDRHQNLPWGEGGRRRADEAEGDRQEDGGMEMMSDQGRQIPAPRSLLVITKNRCRYGARWYGGGLRCYCDGDGSITCGDPMFVSTRIDGFRLEKVECEEGHAWYEDAKCQVCECKYDGVVFCRRSETCPLPFLIQPVADLHPPAQPIDTSNEARSQDERLSTDSHEQKEVDRRSDLQTFSRLPGGDAAIDDIDSNGVDEREKSRPGFQHSDKSGGDKTIDLSLDLTRKPPMVIDRDRHHPYHYHKHHYNPLRQRFPPHRRNNNNILNHKAHTTVIVTECNPGSRWMDGCKRCKCDRNGKKHCDDRLCPKPVIPRLKPPRLIARPGNVHDGSRPVQLPPAIWHMRDEPVTIKSPFNIENPCGQYKIGEMYRIKCNRCLCTSHGPKCTAMNCG